MNSSDLLCSTGSRIVLAAFAIGGSCPLRASDRFIVPVPESAPPPSPPPSSGGGDSGSSSSGSSGSSGSTYDSGRSDYSPPSDRFIVPVPRGAPRRGGGGYSGPGGYGRGGYYDDYYWGGCYYWGGDYYYWGGYYYSPDRGRFGRYYDDSYVPYARIRSSRDLSNRLPIYFPPDPPPLGSPIPPPPPGIPYLTAPDELAEYVADPFYAPLSSRLAKRNLSAALIKRLEDYRLKKAELQAELKQHLVTLALMNPAAKARDLQEFSLKQTPQIAALEATAEALRVDLLRVGLVGVLWGSGDWSEHRQWRLGSGPLALPREQTLAAEFQVVRAAAFYQGGFLPEQRRLLREVAMELQVRAFKPKNATDAAEDGSVIFFSPDTARIHLPDGLAPEVINEVTAYTREKSALKEELREVVYREDSASPMQRLQAIRQLAAAQAGRLAALEGMAEQIRRDLGAAQSGTALLQSLPSELATKVVELQRRWRALQDGLSQRLAEINQSFGPGEVRFIRKSDGAAYRSSLSVQVADSSHVADIRQRVQAAMAAYNREWAPQFAALQQDSESLRKDIAAYSAIHPDAFRGKSVEAWWKETVLSERQGDPSLLYGDYQTAVFEPGLSPEQRRLLFDAALRALRLPLPGGERQP